MNKNRFTIKIDEKEGSSNTNNFNNDFNIETKASLTKKMTFNKQNKNILNLNLDDNMKEDNIQPKNSENNQDTKIIEFFKEKERLLIENHFDAMIQNLLNFMQGANSGLDLSYFW